MIIAVYITGLAAGLIVLAAGLRGAGAELNRLRREREVYIRAIQAWPLTAATVRELAALPAEGRAGW